CLDLRRSRPPRPPDRRRAAAYRRLASASISTREPDASAAPTVVRASGIEVMNPTPVDWRNDRTRVELPHGQPDGEDPQVARTREEVLAGGTRPSTTLRTYLSGWKIPRHRAQASRISA